MKIAIVSNVDIRHMSLISIYTDFFERNDIKYDLINSSDLTNNKYDSKIYTYQNNINRHESRLKNFINNKKYLNFVKKKLSDEMYDYIIIWRSEVGFLLLSVLLNKYKGRYIVNIRDYAGENRLKNKIKQRILTKYSKMNVISSNGFLSFLPSDNYIHVHSLNKSILEDLKLIRTKEINSKKIRLGFIGNIRFLEKDKMILNAFKNDDRFIIQYFGTGSDKLKSYAKENLIKNCEFIDAFDIKETSKLLDRIDLINNMFGNDSISVRTLVSIRYYHSLTTLKPFVTNNETYMADLTQDNKLGYVFDGDYKTLPNKLYQWYENLNFEDYKKLADEELLEIHEENLIFEKELTKIFRLND